MSFLRVKAILLNSWFHLTHSLETWIDLFWFSIINVLVFGLISRYLSPDGTDQQAAFMLLGLILWGVIFVGQYSITVSALWEIWSKSFTSLFVTPLKFSEFILGHILGGCIKAVGVFFATAFIAYVFYGFSIFQLGWVLLIFFIELLIFSWSAGIFVLGLIMRYGTTIQSLAWGLVFLVQPLGAVFVPVEVLPSSIRWMSYILPTTYIFESARARFSFGSIRWDFLVYGTVLNAVFFFGSYLFLHTMIQHGKRTGSFARMEH